jgi:hypothetical protein
MPMLGIMASQISGNLSSYDSISTATVTSGGTASITFSSIPQTYTHLQLRSLVQTNRSSTTGDYLSIRFNGDTASNYNGHYLGGNGTIAVAGPEGNSTAMYLERSSCSTTPNIFSGMIWDILDYGSTVKNKTVRSLAGYDINADPLTYNISLISGLWMNSTTGISSITIAPGAGTAFNQYSSFALYGIK